MAPHVYIDSIASHVGQQVTIKGWLQNKRSSGKLHFLIVRDGTGFLQATVYQGDVAPEIFKTADHLSQESAIQVSGAVRAEPRAPGGFELGVQDLVLLAAAQEYPISPKEHGIEFLLDKRHLWLRSRRPFAALRIRAEVIAAIQDFLNQRGFVHFDAPILTGSAVEGTSNLFAVQYFDQAAYLSQSGQLYAEAGALALGKVYTFGPTFRAEKSKTRRHLIEFWMIEPEAAYYDFEDNLRLQEELVSYVVQRVLERRQTELAMLERDTSQLKNVLPPFPRVRYDDALKILAQAGQPLPWGEDLGAPHETIMGEQFDRPVFVTHYPAQVKAFYMEPDPERPETVKCADLIAPEGYGEIIGGSERIHDLELLRRRIAEFGLDESAYQWYLDLRRFGTVPHSGFGLGLERTVAWICGLDHLREAIPFPRLLNRLTP